MLDFVALDFETANKFPNSACSLAVVTVENGVLTKRGYSLIKPPFMKFDNECIAIHGIQPQEVMNKPTFDKLWPAIYENHLKGKILLAHNAKFDMGVLRATLDHYNIEWPDMYYSCTVKISKRVWPNLENHRLNTMGAYLGYNFRHHYALDDAEVCAQVAIAAAREKNANSIDELLNTIGLKREAFITDEKRKEMQKAVQEAEQGEQVSFF
ncbi:MAG: 3'-5' exonuclease [Veillonella sp.]|uniref:3'-5' exonuclease n=1 Tax=Veillonella sp. TaxID=1926307 RepID=UPI0025E49640|nr:3'-5' exonuclease [Veillonella sp.]MBS4914068.1 3'-5' exonuclease [Veillonella sp.]